MTMMFRAALACLLSASTLTGAAMAEDDVRSCIVTSYAAMQYGASEGMARLTNMSTGEVVGIEEADKMAESANALMQAATEAGVLADKMRAKHGVEETIELLNDGLKRRDLAVENGETPEELIAKAEACAAKFL